MQRTILFLICLSLLHSAAAQGDFQEEDDVRILEIQVCLFYRGNSILMRADRRLC
jgi:hypothetical protein